MGVLRDIKNNRNNVSWGPGPILFWAAVGAGLGGGFASVIHLPPPATIVLATMVGVLGIGVGFYACFATTKLARVLALPGIILGLCA